MNVDGLLRQYQEVARDLLSRGAAPSILIDLLGTEITNAARSTANDLKAQDLNAIGEYLGRLVINEVDKLEKSWSESNWSEKNG